MIAPWLFASVFRKRIAAACAAMALSAAAPAAELHALTENLPPLNYEEAGTPTGYSTELLQAMLHEAGLQATFAVQPWARAYQTALTQPNTILYSLVRTAEREPLFHWIGPISKRRIWLFRLRDRDDIKAATLADVHQYRIGVVYEMAATKALMASGFAMQRELDGAPNDDSNVKKLFARRVDMILALDWSAYYHARQNGRQADELVPVLLTDDSHSYYFGVSKGSDPETVARLEAALEKVRAAGVLERLRKKYMGQ